MRAISKYTTDGRYIETYESIKEAAGSVDVTPTQIYQCVHRKNKFKPNTCKGYVWKYANEQEDKMNILEFKLKNDKKISLTEKEAEASVKFYRVMLSMLNELQKNPRMIPALQQAMYDSIKEIENAKSETSKESAETEENANKTEWKPFVEGFASTGK